GYGCRFLNLTPQQESQLRSYIFQEERRLYHPD
ncbi:MAG: PilZ domain-containing protein, partial [Angelakisella sp.]|nr:PilZ domain-containing protein [Angelakisella sp.]